MRHASHKIFTLKREIFARRKYRAVAIEKYDLQN